MNFFFPTGHVKYFFRNILEKFYTFRKKKSSLLQLSHSCVEEKVKGRLLSMRWERKPTSEMRGRGDPVDTDDEEHCRLSHSL